jgi:hypothetical protein
MGRLRSWRLTAPNEIRFKELHNRLCLANENRTFNAIIERFYEYERYKPAIEHFKGLVKELGGVPNG